MIKVLIFPGLAFISIASMLIVWFERKLLARIMLRIGPLHVGKFAGSLQVVADFVKLLSKEVIVPKMASKEIFMVMPILLATLPPLALMVIPFTDSWYIFRFDYSLLFPLIVISLMPPSVLLAGWSANNKYSFLGGLRAAFQYLAFEIPLLLSMMGVVALARSLDLVEIVKAQSNHWFILIQPIGAIIYFVAMLAENERLPFDLPEAEQELVFGWMTEYSGALFGLLMYGNYERVVVSSLLFTALFLGGWYGPVLIHPAVMYILKTAMVITVVIFLRAVFPRVRMDQLLSIGWRFLAPIALLNLIVSVAIASFIIVW
jgi:NADH-quinone oxidoreductase subunit H